METFLIRALQLIMSLSLLVIVHEGGHFLFSRLFKVRVEKFCIFFDPWFTLFKFKPKKSETEYAIGWLPLGGYVKIAGMIDESMDTDQMKQPEQPWEFRSKPAWQRLLIMVGGVLFNFLLALFIYSMILFHWGDEYIPAKEAKFGMVFNETAKNVGFKDGDIMLSADGVAFTRFDLRSVIDARQVSVLRDGKEVSVYIPEDLMQKLMADSVYFARYIPAHVVGTVQEGSPAMAAGLQPGDSISALNGKPVSLLGLNSGMKALKAEAAGNDSINNRLVSLSYYRDGIAHTASLEVDTAYTLGVMSDPTRGLPLVKVSYGFFESFPAGIALGVSTLKGYVGDMRHVFSKEGAKQLGGFGTIGSIFPAQWDWHKFWYMTAFLSIILAFMNILPIPALDGGHVLFLLYEMIARRKPSDKFMEYAQVTGMVLLFGLLIWANFNDIMRFIF
ncbi:RIP metalloprotease RseP [Bacteroides sp. 51]|uniref:RIP metalloprotease RseP n=1 Tax=Bacteroides sp. 51 TaxID=2302938 RepID=UPI0013D86E25|nr:RIP metalloprotease RseP [Bacteroides sp. 51]NDV84481.1 RIP metalloprotease RseP [Bacteroides sp. 51]